MATVDVDCRCSFPGISQLRFQKGREIQIGGSIVGQRKGSRTWSV